jgi:hypothetical protein
MEKERAIALLYVAKSEALDVVREFDPDSIIGIGARNAVKFMREAIHILETSGSGQAAATGRQNGGEKGMTIEERFNSIEHRLSLLEQGAGLNGEA